MTEMMSYPDELTSRLQALRAGGHEEAAGFIEYLFLVDKLDAETLNASVVDLTHWAIEERERLASIQRTTRRLLGQQICARPKKGGRGPGKATLELREEITAAFERTSKPVTVRQMYYLLTTTGAVDKTEAGYRRVQRQLLLMRRESLIPYDWIADNTRWMRKPRTYEGLRECLTESARFYRASVWRDLPEQVQIWCEKDALAGVLFEETRQSDVPLMVTRGYSSETFAYESAQDICNSGKRCFVYYAGDLDPSGWQASKDLERKLVEFTSHQVTFRRLAVTPEQVREWNLPSRPSKKSDTRHKAFEAKFGQGFQSTELDAVPPDVLRRLAREAIESHIPDGHLKAIEIEECEARETLETMLENFG